MPNGGREAESDGLGAFIVNTLETSCVHTHIHIYVCMSFNWYGCVYYLMTIMVLVMVVVLLSFAVCLIDVVGRGLLMLIK